MNHGQPSASDPRAFNYHAILDAANTPRKSISNSYASTNQEAGSSNRRMSMRGPDMAPPYLAETTAAYQLPEGTNPLFPGPPYPPSLSAGQTGYNPPSRAREYVDYDQPQGYGDMVNLPYQHDAADSGRRQSLSATPHARGASYASSRTASAPTASSASLDRSSTRMTTSSASPGPSKLPPAMPGTPPWTSSPTLRGQSANSASVLNRRRKLPEDADPGPSPKIPKFGSETPEDLPAHEATNASEVDLYEGVTGDANQATDANTNADINEGATGGENEAAGLSPELDQRSKNKTDAKKRRDETKVHVGELRKVLGIRSNVCERDTIALGVKYIISLQRKYAEAVSESEQTRDKLIQEDRVNVDMEDKFRLRDDTKGHLIVLRQVLRIDSRVDERDTIEQAVKSIKSFQEKYAQAVSEANEKLAWAKSAYIKMVESLRLERESHDRTKAKFAASTAHWQALWRRAGYMSQLGGGDGIGFQGT
ncbi:hypothetical protein FA95DRAFT_1619220 [Auriscalpium vulgare]|uniref:Uncharacterized protein n=1 Tax=Auriscalpium vulgare TaxID=40419 RepID=A0ACB8RN59_9AGAM|nr:hypothetical protein FA95DRAFT_1619220 [Auriscalpium vulgare]